MTNISVAPLFVKRSREEKKRRKKRGFKQVCTDHQTFSTILSGREETSGAGTQTNNSKQKQKGLGGAGGDITRKISEKPKQGSASFRSKLGLFKLYCMINGKQSQIKPCFLFFLHTHACGHTKRSNMPFHIQ